MLSTLASVAFDSDLPGPTTDRVEVTSPAPNADVTSPLTVTGRARGPWFFEGSLPVRLEDADDRVIAEGVAQARGEWMTEDWVAFEATLTFSGTDGGRGSLVLDRANPSGLAENAETWSQPVLLP